MSSKNSDDSYEFITNKIHSLRDIYPSLRNKTDAYAFSALCVKSHFYKNNESPFEYELNDIIVDSVSDGGVDILLADTSEENYNLVIGQSKFYKTISYEDILNALIKMANFYKDMLKGDFENVNEKVVSRFLSLSSDTEEESKIIFVLYTSAPRKKISKDRLENKFKEHFSENIKNIELQVFFDSDIEKLIKEAESVRSTVEVAKVNIDFSGNLLKYGEEAVIINVSALSIKELYREYGNKLLTRNLRYHIKNSKIDTAIRETIEEEPDSFWLKNNGITIICDSFHSKWEEIELYNFSIINGAQTVYQLSKSKSITRGNDFYLPCKIIKVRGNNENEKISYSLEISKAANWQKPIKESDLKANAPEQIRFARAMREVGIYYLTKRGDTVPKEFQSKYENADINKIGKLCICSIFQMPGTGRNKTNVIYNPDYYDFIFNKDQSQIAKLCKELLYIDDYFKTNFLKKYIKEHNEEEQVSFANNAKTLCIAFVSLAARYQQGNLKDDDIETLGENDSYDVLKNMEGVKYILPPELFFSNRDEYDKILERLFNIILSEGSREYKRSKIDDNHLNATNFLKNDKNYYKIISFSWSYIKPEIKKIFEDMKQIISKN